MAEEGSGDDERCGAILDGEKAKAVVVAAHNMSRYDDAVFMLLVVYWCVAFVVVDWTTIFDLRWMALGVRMISTVKVSYVDISDMSLNPSPSLCVSNVKSQSDTK